jgi:hypothetical protein
MAKRFNAMGSLRDIYYKNPKAPIRCLTIENPPHAPIQLLSVNDLITAVLEVKNPQRKLADAIRLKQLPSSFQSSLHLFPGHGRREEPVVDGENAVALLCNLTSRKGNAIKEEYNTWICQVLGGSTDIQAIIAANAELAEDPTTFQSVLRPALTAKKVPITYLISQEDKPVVYLRCDPKTYEVFTLEHHTYLPECPELGDDLKFGHAQNLAGREATYETNGVFVFFVTLHSGDDARLLEATLKTVYRGCRRDGTQEYLSLPLLQAMMHELEAKAILDNIKAKILEIINELTFTHTLRVGIFTASSVRETRSGIAVAFDETVVPCHGRVKDQEYQALLKRVREQEEAKIVLAEENQALGKRAREQEEQNEALLRRVSEQEEEIVQLKKRLRMTGGNEVLEL